MTPESAATEEPAETKLYYVPWQAIGSVLVRAHDKDEAVELANERFGIADLARMESACVEDLTFDHKWGPGVDEWEQDDKETPYEGMPAPTPKTGTEG